MRSMTGYGRGQVERDGITVTVEMTAVNRRQQDIRLVLPKELYWLEPRLRTRLQPEVSRGAITVAVTCDVAAARQMARLRIDQAALTQLARELQEAARQAGLRADLSIGDLLAVPGVIPETPGFLTGEHLAEVAEAAALAAFEQLRRMQEREGETLRQDLDQRCIKLQALVAAINDRAGLVQLQLRDRLRERIRLLGLELPVDDERLAKEVVFAVDRADITEELTRLGSHLGQFRDALNVAGIIGRNLDFLCQELGREINTLGAKTADTGISGLALTFKAELERIREQAQNVE